MPFGQKQENSSQEKTRCQITFRIPDEASEAGFEIQPSTIQALAEVLRCSSEHIQIIDESAKSDIFTFEMPTNTFERLLTLGQTLDPIIEKLGIEQVKEVIDEHHDLKNIRTMLAKMFTDEEFRQFCQKHFPAMLETVSPDTKKADLIENLLAHARQTSRIPHILVFAGKHDEKVYKRYEPYYNVPRSFSYSHEKMKQRHPPRSPLRPYQSDLTPKEFVQATAMGIGVATAVTFFVQRVTMIPADPEVMEVLALVWGFIGLLGILVGEVVAKGAHFKRGKLLAIISVGCYWMGMSLGHSLVYLSLFSGGFFHISLIIQSLFIGFLTAIGGLFSLSARMLVLIIGTYFAYRYAR